jgi:hypothetical protein
LNSSPVIQQHPLVLMEQIAACHGSDLVYTYSRYEIAPPGLQAAARRSDVLRVSASELTPGWLADRLAELGPTEELAWHSWVECRGIGFHIPTIDFVHHPGKSTLNDLSSLASELGLRGDFVFYETGRSFHGYFPRLIPQHAWLGYLGRLLLVDQLDTPPVIDTRWIGHSLVRGFAALRWSHNTNRYLAMPHLVSLSIQQNNLSVRQIDNSASSSESYLK